MKFNVIPFLPPAPVAVPRRSTLLPILAVCCGMAIPAFGADPAPGDAGPRPDERERQGPRGWGGPPGGPGGFRGGGPGFMQQEIKLVEKFDKDGDKRLNAAERKEARAGLSEQTVRRRGPGPGFRMREEAPPSTGAKISPVEVATFPGAQLYDPKTLRTFFLEFETDDWEDELEAFKNTDVEVPAKLTIDGKEYPDVGVHFRGMSSFMGVGEGRKRSLNLSLDFVHQGQQVGGYRTLNLLNSHEDPSFLRAVLSLMIAREYIPAPKANFARVVINGESWGVYINAQQFNKDFAQDWFGTRKGARWKVPGSPGGRGSLAYLGDDPASYKGAYEIKSKDEPSAWASLILLCKVLNETPPDKLEAALNPLLDIDGALKFIALETALINSDGYWARTSDYNLFQDTKGRFHIVPHDANETFSVPRGPGMGGFGPGGPGGPGDFGPGMFLAPGIFSEADKNNDEKVTQDEWVALARAWFDQMDPDATGTISEEQMTERLGDVLPAGPPFDRAGRQQAQGRPRGGFGPGVFLAPSLFKAADADADQSVTRTELTTAFGKWHAQWTGADGDGLTEAKLRTGLNTLFTPAGFAGRGGGPGAMTRGGGPGRGGSGRGPGGGQPINGVELDPLFAANDADKPLYSKLLAVPALRTRYLGYVRDIAETWLDWNKLGPIAQEYHALIAADVAADTRKLESTEEFVHSLTGEGERQGRGKISLKSFADQRRAYLLNHAEIKKLER